MKFFWIALGFAVLAVGVLVTSSKAVVRLWQSGTSRETPNEVSSEKISLVESNPVATEASVPLPVSEALVNQALQDYLPQRVLETNYGGKVFCAHHLYGFDEDKSTNLVKAYVWAYCEEYYVEKGSLKMGSGVSMPVRVTLELANGALGGQGHEEPKNGELYAPSIREMFPEKYAEEAIEGYPVKELSPSPEEQAKKDFGSKE